MWFFKEETGFTKDVLYPGFNRGSALAVFDIDQDGDDDIIAGAGILKQLYLFENNTIVTAAPSSNPVSSGLKVVPNPTDGVFAVTIPSRGCSEIEIAILNTQGKLVFIHNMLPVNNQVRISSTGLENGIYILKIIVNDRCYQEKLVISWPVAPAR